MGEIWTDKDGKTWQQRDGYKISVTKFDDLREYLKTITTFMKWRHLVNLWEAEGFYIHAILSLLIRGPVVIMTLIIYTKC